MHEQGNSEIEIKLKISSMSSTSFYMLLRFCWIVRMVAKKQILKRQNTKSRGGTELQN